MQHAEQLRVRCGIYSIVAVGPGGGVLEDDCVRIAATNEGAVDVAVDSIAWRVGFLRRKHAIQIPPQNVYSPKLPVRLARGDTATFVFAKHEFEPGIEEFAMRLGSGPLAQLRARSLRAGVTTSTGRTFVVKPDKGVREVAIRLSEAQWRALDERAGPSTEDPR